MKQKTKQAILFKGNLSRLTEQQKNEFYKTLCFTLGLNPESRPFKLLRLNDKEVLYGHRSRYDQPHTMHHTKPAAMALEGSPCNVEPYVGIILCKKV